MTRYLTLEEVLRLHARVLAQSGGGTGIRDLGLLEAAVAVPRAAFGGEEFYPTLAAKAAAIGFSLIQNHPFVDGNKRVGHAAMEVMLVLNGFELEATVDDSEAIVIAVASGAADRGALHHWVETRLRHT